MHKRVERTRTAEVRFSEMSTLLTLLTIRLTSFIIYGYTCMLRCGSFLSAVDFVSVVVRCIVIVSRITLHVWGFS